MKARVARLMNHIRVYVTRDTKGRTVKVSTGSIINYLIWCYNLHNCSLSLLAGIGGRLYIESVFSPQLLTSAHQTLARTEECASRKTMITSATAHRVLKEKLVKVSIVNSRQSSIHYNLTWLRRFGKSNKREHLRNIMLLFCSFKSSYNFNVTSFETERLSREWSKKIN